MPIKIIISSRFRSIKSILPIKNCFDVENYDGNTDTELVKYIEGTKIINVYMQSYRIYKIWNI